MLFSVCANLRPFDLDLEKRMRTTTSLIHFGFADRTIFHSNLEHVIDLRDALDSEVR